jgi:hypothetical protein
MKTVFNRRFDLAGNEASRLIRLSSFGKLVPIGNWRGGPGLRCLIVVSTLHYLGYPLYWLNAKYGHKLGYLKRILKRG